VLFNTLFSEIGFVVDLGDVGQDESSDPVNVGTVAAD
jgi:hypothetical protein